MSEKLYEYNIRVFNNQKYEAYIYEYKLVAESADQYVYKTPYGFNVMNKKDYNGHDKLLTCEYHTGQSFFNIKPHFSGKYFTKIKSKTSEEKLIKLVEKTVNENFKGFANVNLKIEFKEFKK